MAAEGATLLIADDEPLNVDLLRQELGTAGYRTLSAASGEEALRLAQKEQPDLVLLDVMMPGIDGYDVLKVIRSQEGDPLPVLMLTASADPGSAARGWVDGVDYYLAKPFTPDVVLDIVDSVCGQRIPTTDGA